MDQNWGKKFRILNIALMFSGALNIGLIASLVAFSLQERCSLGGEVSKKGDLGNKLSNVAEISAMSKLTFRELVTLLTNRESIEEGYTKRDLALSTLVSFHHFNLEKALGASILQKRDMMLGDESIALYPGLSNEAFEAVIRFAYQEKWPLTAKGIFSLLQKNVKDESLESAFFITPEFYSLQVLFQKTEAPQDSETLFRLALEGNWELLDRFAKEQLQLLDLSVEKRRRLLLSFLAHKSPTAAELLLKTDFSFAQKRLEDQGIVDLLSLLNQRTEEAEKFCHALATSLRSDVVRKASIQKISFFTGEPVQEVPKVAVVPPIAAPAPTTRYHTVDVGESLWKIARTYKVKVDDIVLLNGIDKDKLYPGMTLKIP